MPREVIRADFITGSKSVSEPVKRLQKVWQLKPFINQGDLTPGCGGRGGDPLSTPFPWNPSLYSSRNVIEGKSGGRLMGNLDCFPSAFYSRGQSWDRVKSGSSGRFLSRIWTEQGSSLPFIYRSFCYWQQDKDSPATSRAVSGMNFICPSRRVDPQPTSTDIYTLLAVY